MMKFNVGDKVKVLDLKETRLWTVMELTEKGAYIQINKNELVYHRYNDQMEYDTETFNKKLIEEWMTDETTE